jgi:hypothetical protein
MTVFIDFPIVPGVLLFRRTAKLPPGIVADLNQPVPPPSGNNVIPLFPPVVRAIPKIGPSNSIISGILRSQGNRFTEGAGSPA